MRDQSKTTGKKAKRRAPSARPESRPGDDGDELDPREAARALKAALARSDAESETAPARRRPRRRISRPAPISRPARSLRRLEADDGDLDPGASRPGFFQRHDLWVILFGLALLAGGTVARRSLHAVELIPLEGMGLRLERPSVLLPPRSLVPRSDGAALRAGDGSPLPYHVVYQSPAGPLLRLEIRVEPRPSYNNLRAALSLDRVSRYGEMYWAASSDAIKLRERDWIRTEFRYGYKAHELDSPKMATAIEFATLNGSLLYVVTAHGNPEGAVELADLIAPTLAADANHRAASGIRREDG